MGVSVWRLRRRSGSACDHCGGTVGHTELTVVALWWYCGHCGGAVGRTVVAAGRTVVILWSLAALW